MTNTTDNHYSALWNGCNGHNGAASPDGYKYLLNMIDVFTSWPEAVPLKTLTAEETTKAF
jgi:hypothetical protein